MTPKEKAEELRGKFSDTLYEGNGTSAGAISCAIIAVDEIILSKPILGSLEYWQEVKEELTKL